MGISGQRKCQRECTACRYESGYGSSSCLDAAPAWNARLRALPSDQRGRITLLLRLRRHALAAALQSTHRCPTLPASPLSKSVVVRAAEVVPALGADQLAVVALEPVSARGADLAMMLDGIAVGGAGCRCRL